jgi:hypothetical protein
VLVVKQVMTAMLREPLPAGYPLTGWAIRVALGISIHQRSMDNA